MPEHLQARAGACQRREFDGRRFGSAITDLFDADHSDVAFLVEFLPGLGSYFDAYFGLLEDLTELLGRDFDLAMSNAVENPYFTARVSETARELYGA